MGQKKQLVKTAGIYAIGNFGTKILNFIFVPVYTYFVTTAEMGTYDLISTFIWMLQPLAVLQIQDGMFRWIIGHEREENLILSTGYRIILVSLFITNVIYWGLSFYVTIPYPILTGILINVTAMNPVLLQITRAKQNKGIYVLGGIISTVLTILSNFLMVCVFHLGLFGLLLSMTVSYLLTDIFLILAQPSIIKINFKNILPVEELKKLLIYSVMLIPNSMSFWILNSSDRLIISLYMGQDANGIYAIANKFPGMLQMLGNILIQAFTEQAITNYNKEDRFEYYSSLFNTIGKFLLGGVLLCIPVTKYVVQWSMSSAYETSWRYTGFLYIGVVYFIFTSFYGSEYISRKKTTGAFVTTTMAAGINLAVHVILIDKIGLSAASISTMAAYMALWLIRVLHLRKSFVLSVEWIKIIGLTVVGIVYSAAVNYTDGMLDAVLFAIGLMIFVSVNFSVFVKVIKRIKEYAGKFFIR